MNVNREAQRNRAADKLLAAVRINRPEDKILLSYLEDYCGDAWRVGFEAGERAERTKQRAKEQPK